MKKEHGWGELILFQLEYIFKQFEKRSWLIMIGSCEKLPNVVRIILSSMNWASVLNQPLQWNDVALFFFHTAHVNINILVSTGVVPAHR